MGYWASLCLGLLLEASSSFTKMRRKRSQSNVGVSHKFYFSENFHTMARQPRRGEAKKKSFCSHHFIPYDSRQISLFWGGFLCAIWPPWNPVDWNHFSWLHRFGSVVRREFHFQFLFLCFSTRSDQTLYARDLLWMRHML